MHSMLDSSVKKGIVTLRLLASNPYFFSFIAEFRICPTVPCSSTSKSDNISCNEGAIPANLSFSVDSISFRSGTTCFGHRPLLVMLFCNMLLHAGLRIANSLKSPNTLEVIRSLGSLLSKSKSKPAMNFVRKLNISVAIICISTCSKDDSPSFFTILSIIIFRQVQKRA